MPAIVALTQGDQRYNTVAEALRLIDDQIDLRDCRRLVIKPNFVSVTRQLAATHVDAVRAVLDMVRARYDGPIAIAEGSALDQTARGFANFGYLELVKLYDLTLVDLNADEAMPMQTYDRHGRPQVLRLARTILESDFRISVGPPKTHDVVLVTLSLKNMIMGTLVNRAVATAQHRAPALLARAAGVARRVAARSALAHSIVDRLKLPEASDKYAMHQGFGMMNINLARVAPLVRPHLAVIDGFVGMEGAGPIDGAPVDWRIALASVDALAVDTLTTHLMGFNPTSIGYLSYCRRLDLGVGTLDQIHIRGTVDPARVRRSFQPHPTAAQQRGWQIDHAEQWLPTRLVQLHSPKVS
jgi:uncharacterized protein (DUF362 family)